jgi:hypothetical protein
LDSCFRRTSQTQATTHKESIQPSDAASGVVTEQPATTCETEPAAGNEMEPVTDNETEPSTADETEPATTRTEIPTGDIYTEV